MIHIKDYTNITGGFNLTNCIVLIRMNEIPSASCAAKMKKTIYYWNMEKADKFKNSSLFELNILDLVKLSYSIPTEHNNFV